MSSEHSRALTVGEILGRSPSVSTVDSSFLRRSRSHFGQKESRQHYDREDSWIWPRSTENIDKQLNRSEHEKSDAELIIHKPRIFSHRWRPIPIDVSHENVTDVPSQRLPNSINIQRTKPLILNGRRRPQKSSKCNLLFKMRQ
jgi:hypothetical protein